MSNRMPTSLARPGARRFARDPERGMTLMEVMIASAILVFMMALAWRAIGDTSTARRNFEAFQDRNHEYRMAMARLVADFEEAYLSRNEDQNSTNPRTLFVARSSGKVPEIKFSTLGHRVLWADANESEQTLIQYLAKDHEGGGIDLIRREQRRLSNQQLDEEPAEYDLLLANIERIKFEFWNWKNQNWQDTWDTTQSDGQRNWLPSRVRITVTIKNLQGKEQKLVTQARILLQEVLNFAQ